MCQGKAVHTMTKGLAELGPDSVYLAELLGFTWGSRQEPPRHLPWCLKYNNSINPNPNVWRVIRMRENGISYSSS